MEEPRRILVVKLGALGNVILSLGPFATIRRHHAGAHITLLTTAPFADWLARSPWFDAVWIDERPEWWDLAGWLRLRRRLIDGTVRPRLRSADLRPLQPLLPAPAAARPAGLVGHRPRLRAAGPRSEPQPDARHRPPVRPTSPGRHRPTRACRSVLEPRRHHRLRLARAFRAADPREFAAPSGETLADRPLSGAGRHAVRARPDTGRDRHRAGAAPGARDTRVRST